MHFAAAGNSQDRRKLEALRGHGTDGHRGTAPPFERAADESRLMNEILTKAGRIFRDALQISYELFKIMVPLLIVVKILKELGVVEVLGRGLTPFMEVVGLPGSSGLIWATTMVTNIYTGMVVFVSLTSEHPITVAQTTVLASMMLMAHGLPVELRIAQKAGARLVVMAAVRIGGAFLFGFILNRVYLLGNWFQQPNILTWVPPVRDTSHIAWALGELRNLVMIFCIILCLLIMLRILGKLGITRLITKCLQPVLRLLGIGEEASTITIVGMTLGLAYGGGLIIREAQSGRLDRRDILYSLALMGLSHSLIEDTVLLMLLGGRLSGIFWGRIAFSLLCIYLMVRIIACFPDSILDRWLFQRDTT